MLKPFRNLPSSRTLLAFEAVIRLGTVTAAAEEMGSSQPAVSQLLKALEDALGVPLFDRSGRVLVPTQQALKLYDTVAASFRDIAREVESIRVTQTEQTVEIGANFGFAHLWLLPRLGDLKAAFPAVRFMVLSGDRDDDPEVRRCDLTIRFGRNAKLMADEAQLCTERVLPVCSPALLSRDESGGGNAGHDMLERQPLLRMDENDPRWLNWDMWFRMTGRKIPGGRPNVLYNNYPLLINAAMAGEGVALGWECLVADLVASGRLVCVGPTVERKDHAYILHRNNSASPIVREVADWIERAFT